MGAVKGRDESVMKPGVIVTTTQVCSLPACGGGLGRGCLRSETPQEDKALTRRSRDDASHRPGIADLSRKRERCTEPAARLV
ncbi:hypothetical protein AXW67_19425 [Bradyrhizobium neotropicale]|uniref:Uncharacterized protein n=1 Tax=Bradyrhizobium neotropicale TaxID=1497615 RepID=A0A176YYG0_9BRAD|nr:hypothetical protein AXW67_19425 [Bradyrhizobium neotropicale]